MLRAVLLLSLALPLSGYCQTYADSPFYQPVSAIPSTAHVDGYEHGSIHANGVVIDLSEWVPASSPDVHRVFSGGGSEAAAVDGKEPDEMFHFYTEHDGPHAVFGYDLFVQPVPGTDQIRCTFSTLTDPMVGPQSAGGFRGGWGRNKEIAPVALPADLSPVVVHSGDVLAVRMLPLGPGSIADIHYLRLIRTDLTPDDLASDGGIASDPEPPPEAPVDLLRRIAEHYANADSFEVRGTASALVAGTSWRASYDFETEAAQPAFLPLNLHAVAMQALTRVRNPRKRQVVPGATDPMPAVQVPMIPFGQYNLLARRLVDAQKTGDETVTVQGHKYQCETIDAVYDYSPSSKPHSVIRHKRLSVDPSDLLVLRETNSVAGFDWQADVTEFWFGQPPSDAMTEALERIAAEPKDRPEWVGRTAPEFALQQLSGTPVNLSQLRGKVVLLDFWESYCGPCRRTTLYAQELQKRYGASGLVVLTLTRDTPGDARLWTDQNHITLPVLLDSNGAAFRAFDVQGVPVTVLIGESGNVAHYWAGLEDVRSMDSVVNASLQAHP